MTGELLIADTLSNLLGVAEEHGFETRFRWVRREFVQDADDLSNVVDGGGIDWLAAHGGAGSRAGSSSPRIHWWPTTVANNDDCFSGSFFTTRLFAFRTQRL